MLRDLYIKEFTDANISFVTQGKNVGANGIGINCIFCMQKGMPDPSHHLIFDVSQPRYHCWRCGSSPTTTGISTKALLKTLCNKNVALPILNRLVPIKNTPQDIAVKKPKNTTPLLESDLAIAYLKTRQYSEMQIEYIADVFKAEVGTADTEYYKDDQVKYIKGKYKDRLILYATVDNVIKGWTARTINNNPIRYLNNSKLECNSALSNIVFPNYFKNNATLVIQEGYFDAIKINYFGNIANIYSIALNTLSISEQQITYLYRKKDLFKKTFILIDAGNSVAAATIQNKLWWLSPVILSLTDYKDTGEMSDLEIKRFIKTNIDVNF